MARFKNIDWSIKVADGRPNAAQNVDEASLAVLMDIRDELQDIKKNTTKKRKPRRRTPATK